MSKGDPQDALEFNPVGSHNSGTDISSVVTLTPPTGATKILMQSTSRNVRFTLDGTAATSSNGFMLYGEKDPLMIPMGNDTTLKVIEEEATAAFRFQWGQG